MPHKERDAHTIKQIEDIGHGAPRRILFFDSESWIHQGKFWLRRAKSSSPQMGVQSAQQEDLLPKEDMLFHKPRLITGEMWSRGRAGEEFRQERLPHDGVWSDADFTTPDALCFDFWEAISQIALKTEGHGKGRTKLTVIAHNIGYDAIATGLYTQLPAHRCHNPDGSEACHGWEMEKFYEKGPIFIGHATHGRHQIELLSSTNWFHASLKDVGKTFGLKKLEPPGGFNTPNTSDLLPYCRRDVEILRSAVLWYIRTLYEQDIGPFRPTTASIAFSAWRHRWLDHRISIHTNADAINLERLSLHGGRTEVFYRGTATDPNGEARYYDVDVNNLYGYVMRDALLPTRLREMRRIGEDETMTLDEICAAPDIIIEADVWTDQPIVPVAAGKLLFPVGTFRATLCSPEIRNLLLWGGKILKVHQWARYDMAPIFREMVLFTSAQRAEAKRNKDEALANLWKDITNHSYGKFGQKQDEWTRIGDPTPEDTIPSRSRIDNADGSHYIRVVLPGGVYMTTGVRTEAYNSFPAIGAFITSQARTELWDVMAEGRGKTPEMKEPWTAGEVMYCDTDSAFISQVGYDRLVALGRVDPSELGKVKVEWRARSVEIRGAKAYKAEIAHPGHTTQEIAEEMSIDHDGNTHYGKYQNCAGDRTRPHFNVLEKMKGVPLGRATIVDTPNGKRYAYDQFPKIGSHIRSGDVGHFHNQEILKRMDVDYNKAVEGPNGWMRPFRFPLEDPAVSATTAAAT